MGASHVVAICSVLDELYTGIQQDIDFCATFETGSGDLWIQLAHNALNMAWPYDEADAAKLERLFATKLPQCRILSIEAGKYVTFEIALASKDDMAGWIDWVFTSVFKVSSDYVLNSEIIQL